MRGDRNFMMTDDRSWDTFLLMIMTLTCFRGRSFVGWRCWSIGVIAQTTPSDMSPRYMKEYVCGVWVLRVCGTWYFSLTHSGCHMTGRMSTQNDIEWRRCYFSENNNNKTEIWKTWKSRFRLPLITPFNSNFNLYIHCMPRGLLCAMIDM